MPLSPLPDTAMVTMDLPKMLKSVAFDQKSVMRVNMQNDRFSIELTHESTRITLNMTNAVTTKLIALMADTLAEQKTGDANILDAAQKLASAAMGGGNNDDR